MRKNGTASLSGIMLLPPQACVLEEHFGGALTASVLVEWPAELPWSEGDVQAALREVTAFLEEHPFTHAPLSALDLVELLPPGMRTSANVSALPDELVSRFVRPELGAKRGIPGPFGRCKADGVVDLRDPTRRRLAHVGPCDVDSFDSTRRFWGESG